MYCPYCKSKNQVVYAHKQYNKVLDKTIRYRRCNDCGMTFKTKETYSPKTLEEVEEAISEGK